MTTTLDRLDQIRIELKRLGKQIGGINPKLSLYAKLQKEMQVLNTELEILRKKL